MIHYSKTLTPTQSVEMSQFLKTLLCAADKAKEAGVKPDVKNFMKAWIGIPVTEEEKRQRHMGYQRDYGRRRREARRLANGK